MGLSLLDKEASQANLIKEIERLAERVAVLERTAWTGVKESSSIRARVYHSSDTTIADSTDTYIPFDSEHYDTDGIHDVSANTGRLMAVHAGLYQINASVRFASNATGFRYLSIWINRTSRIASVSIPAISGSVAMLGVGTQYYLPANYYVEARVYQNSGGDLDILSSNYSSPEFMMARIA